MGPFNFATDDFDYKAAGLLSPLDCDPFDPPRLCFGCKFETLCNTNLDCVIVFDAVKGEWTHKPLK